MELNLTNILVGYGPLGVILAVIAPILWSFIKETKERAERHEKEVARLNGLLLEQVVPLLGTATEATNQSQQTTKVALDYIRALQYQKDVEDAARRSEGK